MTRLYIGMSVLAVAVLASCSDNVDRASESVTKTGGAGPFGPSATSAPAEMHKQVADSAAASAPIVAPAPVTTVAAGTNPPHGQPGHTCDIPVGAPLDSKPTTGATPTVGQPPTPITIGSPGVTVTPTTIAQPQAAAPAANASPASSGRINPPHGQPGHSCDVKVGDPLPQ